MRDVSVISGSSNAELRNRDRYGIDIQMFLKRVSLDQITSFLTRLNTAPFLLLMLLMMIQHQLLFGAVADHAASSHVHYSLGPCCGADH